jgi:hypothetical protein
MILPTNIHLLCWSAAISVKTGSRLRESIGADEKSAR